MEGREEEGGAREGGEGGRGGLEEGNLGMEEGGETVGMGVMGEEEVAAVERIHRRRAFRIQT